MAQGMNLKASIWHHFERQENNKEAKCRYCHKLLCFSSGSSSNLKRHLSRKHPTIPLTRTTTENLMDLHTSTPSASSSNVTPAVVGTSSDSASISTFAVPLTNTIERYIKKPLPINTKREIDLKLTAMIFSGYHPFSIVEEPGFRDFIKTLNISYDLPDRKTISNALVPSMYIETLNKVKGKITTATTFSLTMDGWTNINNTSFYAVTSHFIDENEQLCSFLLECSEFTISHTGQNIAQWLKTVLSSFGIQDKIIAIVTDNASNMKSAADSAKINHIPCFAHCLNLIVQEGIEKAIKATVDEVKLIVRHFKKSTKATKKLEEMQKNLRCQVLKLKQDIPTRWNSTNDMLARFLKNKEPLLSCLGILNIKCNLQDKDWLIIEQSIDVLELFNLATTEVSAEKNVTLSKMGVICRILIAELRKTLENPNLVDEVRIMVRTLLNQSLQRLSHVKNNDIVLEAIFLDPRYKQEGFMEDSQLFKQTYDKIVQLITEEQTQNLLSQSAQSNDNSDECSSAPVNRLWANYDSQISNRETTLNPQNTIIREIDNYLKDIYLSRNADPLSWWKQNKIYYPNLHTLMIKRLCIPATSVPCERIFSKTGQISTERRNRLKSKKVEELIFLNYNYRR